MLVLFRRIFFGLMVIFPTIFVVGQTTDAGFDSLFAEKLQEKLNELGSTGNYRGVSAAVRVPGQGIWTGTYGLAAPGVPLQPGMRLGIASNTKAITAGLLLKLQDEGLLDLDDSIASYLPDYPQVDENITIRQLLNHSTGLFDFINDWSSTTQAAYSADDDRTWSLTDLMNTLGAPYFSPGEQFDYSNTNFLVAGLVAEAAGGATLGQLYHQYVFDPLALNMAYPPHDAIFNQPYSNLWNSAGNGVSLTGNGDRTFLTFPASAGAVWSTPYDLVRWYHALFNTDWLSPTGREDLTYHDGYIAYTTGVRMRNDIGRSLYYHAGAWGFRSYLLYDPSSGISVALLSNQYGTSVSSAALDLFAEVLAEQPPAERDIRLVEVIPVGTACTVDQPYIVVKNEGVEEVSSLAAAVGLNGVWYDTLDISVGAGLASGQQLFVPLPFSLLNASGKMTLQIALITPEPDDVPNNNYREVNYEYLNGMGNPLPFVEDFEEEGEAYPAALMSRQQDNLLDWAITRFAAANGAQSFARINYYDGNIGQHYAFDLPVLYIGADNAQLSFAYAHAIYPGVGREDLRGYISTNCGANFEPLFELTNNDLSTTLQTTELFLPTPDEWATHQVDLSAYVGEDVIIRFELENEFGNLTYLDDITVDVPTRLPELTPLEVQVVPNPARDQASIFFGDNFQPEHFQFLDAYGRVLTSRAVAGNESNLIISRGDLPSGSYFIHLFSRGQVFIRRIVFYE